MTKFGIIWDDHFFKPSIFPELGEIEYLAKKFVDGDKLLVLSICHVKPKSYCVSDDVAMTHMLYQGKSKDKAIQTCIRAIVSNGG